MTKKWRYKECRCVRRRVKWGQNSGLGRRVIFPYSKIIKIALDAHNLEIFLGIYFSNHTNKRAGTPWTNLKCRADRLWTNHHDCKEKQTILRFVAKKLSLNREILNEYASIHGGLCREPGPGKHHSPGAGILINLKIWLSTCVKSYV